MALRRTEEQHPDAGGLDLKAPLEVSRLLADAQLAAAGAVLGAVGPLSDAAAIVADTLRGGGRLAYAAAGSSALMALADALELPGTFGIAPERVVVLIAGGQAALSHLAGGPEDDPDEARHAIGKAELGAGDCLIAISASGSTPYAVAALAEARRRGMPTIAIANNAATPLVEGADIGIAVETPPEIIAGSTRMGAGTAQKIALNMLSTLAAIRLGHVHDGYMVNLRADNAKLRDRAARMVAAIAGCPPEVAAALLDQAEGSVKVAVLLAAGAIDGAAARELLESEGGMLRAALSRLESGNDARKHGT